MDDIILDGAMVRAVAGEALTAFCAVAIVDDLAVLASNTNAAHKGSLRGLIRNSASTSDSVLLKVYGPVKNPLWSWTPEQPVYLGVNGQLTQTKPTSGFVQVVGWADTATQLFINPREPREQTENHVHTAEQFTLNSTDITNKYVLLALTPLSTLGVQLFVHGAPPLRYSVDFQMDGSNPKKLTWAALGLDGLLEAGDRLTVHYFREPS